MSDSSVLKSYAFHNGKCWFVSTITRDYDLCVGTIRGQETLVWEYDFDKSERGNLIHQAGNIQDHFDICRSLCNYGQLPKED